MLPLSQHNISSWTKGAAKNLKQQEAAHNFVVASGHNFLRYHKIKHLKMLLAFNGLNF